MQIKEKKNFFSQKITAKRNKRYHSPGYDSYVRKEKLKMSSLLLMYAITFHPILSQFNSVDNLAPEIKLKVIWSTNLGLNTYRTFQFLC